MTSDEKRKHFRGRKNAGQRAEKKLEEMTEIIARLHLENENAFEEIERVRRTESRKTRVLVAYKFDDVTYLDGSRLVHKNLVITPAETLATLRGFKSDITTLKEDGKQNLIDYITFGESKLTNLGGGVR